MGGARWGMGVFVGLLNRWDQRNQQDLNTLNTQLKNDDWYRSDLVRRGTGPAVGYLLAMLVGLVGRLVGADTWLTVVLGLLVLSIASWWTLRHTAAGG